MICDPCSTAAAEQKKILDERPDAMGSWPKHPQDCGCTCQHRDAGTVLFEGRDT